MLVWVIVAVFALGAYLLFRDTMNRIQYLQSVRIYWITRNNGVRGTSVLTKAFMRQTASPWWRGRGVQVRLGKHTFQVGILTGKADSLLDQMDGRELDHDATQIRAWNKRQEDAVVHPQG